MSVKDENKDGDHWKPESHWDDHDEYPPDNWIREVENGDTRLGYIAWVNHQIEMANEDPGPEFD